MKRIALLGIFYLVVGAVFGALAGGPGTAQRVWRLAAWVVSGVAFVAQLWYERRRLHASPTVAARNCALASALGAFLLAAAANVHSATTGTGQRGRLHIALVIWPLITAIPAFVVAWILGAMLRPERAATPVPPVGKD
jgi:hypothetical protein